MTRRFAIHQVDAFADAPFTGNPAAVVPLENARALGAEAMQAIALENNLSETAFFWPEDDGSYGLRWFTPAVEVDLCGHATLASAWVAFHALGHQGDTIRFMTRSGELRARRAGDDIEIDLPALASEAVAPDPAVRAALGEPVVNEAHRNHTLFLILEDEQAVRAVAPDMSALARALHAADLFAVVVTAPGGPVSGADVVARFFAPTKGVPEDPVTGSMWAALAPLWAARLGRAEFTGFQASARGGRIRCVSQGERTRLVGAVAPYLKGEITI